ncbi:MAG TPA: sigma-70 family RNA polymerase sigma factor [Candidatus Limnocylindrales bacterium]|nr:sigma-70 family RNA polymerase sigma factor [Candidatus Limnocylindrales bacterium]
MAMSEPVDRRYQVAYDRFAADVFRFTLAWTNDWAAAEDLTQETYLRLWRHRLDLDWERPMLPWLLVTARRLSNNRFRALMRSLPQGRASIDSNEAVRDRWLDVRAALRNLTQLERAALILTAVEGWTYAEIADALETTDGALRAAVSRARVKLGVA